MLQPFHMISSELLPRGATKGRRRVAACQLECPVIQVLGSEKGGNFFLLLTTTCKDALDTLLMMKTEAEETGPPTGGDPYVSAAAALDQAQRLLSIAHAQLKPPTISVAVAEQRLDALRSEIVALKVLVEKDRVEIEGLRKARVAVKERERLAFAAYVKQQRGMKKEHEQKLQDMSQLFRPNPLPETPQAATLPPAGPSKPNAGKFYFNPTPSHRWVTTAALYRKQIGVPDETDQVSANSRKRRPTPINGVSPYHLSTHPETLTLYSSQSIPSHIYEPVL
ncbi:hypothetical protein B0H11DRAFT_1924214 [Mycena galericulata]|nr:hypothetical protein B0H11DRAFT_1924214 [Mycena galericulata]